MKVLVIGHDQTCRGGIASVSNIFFEESKKGNAIDYTLLKTTAYKDGTKLHNLYLFLRALIYSLFLIPNSDVVHLQGSSHSSFYRKIFFLIICKTMNKPIVWNFHASRFEDFFSNQKGVNKTVKKYFLLKSTKIVVLCSQFKSIFEREYSLNNVVVLKNPAEEFDNLEECNLKIIHNKEYSAWKSDLRIKLLFIGFFIENKGVKDLLELNRIAGLDTKISIAFAGKGELEKDINLAGMEQNNIANIGWLETPEKVEVLKAADILILPSYREGMPIVILEAMSMGIPVVATNIAGIPEQIEEGKNGYLFSPGNISEMECAILKAGQPGSKLRAKNFNLEKIKEFSPKNVFTELLNIYHSSIK